MIFYQFINIWPSFIEDTSVPAIPQWVIKRAVYVLGHLTLKLDSMPNANAKCHLDS